MRLEVLGACAAVATLLSAGTAAAQAVPRVPPLAVDDDGTGAAFQLLGDAGSVGVPNGSIAAGYVGVQTDTGHSGGSGTFGMLTAAPNGAPDVQLQTDFAYRSEHEMAVIE